jgi:flavin-dependent dehydrogenase
MTTDIIIAGKGIAGLVLSLLLEQKGIPHVLLGRTGEKKVLALGETLPPSALPLLQGLNLLEIFEANALQKTHGYHSVWSSSTVFDNNFYFHHPYKYGLKINKQGLTSSIAQLQQKHLLHFDKQLHITATDKSITVSFESNQQPVTIRGKIIVDASGRNRSVLAALGIPTVEHDTLVAFSCHIARIKLPKLVHPVYVESFETGWGIVSAINEAENVITLFTNKGNAIQQQLQQYSNWPAILAGTTYLKDFLPATPNSKITGAKAGSSRAQAIAGKNWLAIGDAAIAFDPLSSHGITNAIYTAQKAATAIEAYLQNTGEAILKEYDDTLQTIFTQYNTTCRQLYSIEKRWPEAAFWKLRI